MMSSVQLSDVEQPSPAVVSLLSSNVFEDQLKQSQVLTESSNESSGSDEAEVVEKVDQVDQVELVDLENEVPPPMQKQQSMQLVFPNNYDTWFTEQDLHAVRSIDRFQLNKQLQSLQIYKSLDNRCLWKSVLILEATPGAVAEQLFSNERNWNTEYITPLQTDVEVQELDLYAITDHLPNEVLRRARFIHLDDHFVVEHSHLYQILHHIQQVNKYPIPSINSTSTLTSELRCRNLVPKIEQLQNLEYLMEFNRRI
jgi:hypothetical protein